MDGPALHLGQALHEAVQRGGAFLQELGLASGVVVARLGQAVQWFGGVPLAEQVDAVVLQGLHGKGLGCHMAC